MTPGDDDDARIRRVLLEGALWCADQGYDVLPCKPRTKQPLITAGFKGATRDRAQIRTWWKFCPRANVAIVPGSAGHVVIDVDGEEGRATAERLGLLSSCTRTVRTARGLHLYFLHPGGDIGNRKLGPGLDVRADRGYVMVPPSIHPDGSLYTWVEP